MKCSEALEYIQRKLDDDLLHSEEEQLRSHLSACVSCQEQYDKFVNVSSQLEALPKVTPPHSIVDSILPELDKQMSTQGSPLESELQRMKKDNNQINVKTWFLNKKWWATGTVAAAGLLFVLLFNMKDPALDLDQANEMESNGNYMNESVTMDNDQGSQTDSAKEKNMGIVSTEGPDSADSAKMPIKGDEQQEASVDKETNLQAAETTSLTDERSGELSPNKEYKVFKNYEPPQLTVWKDDQLYFAVKWETEWKVSHSQWKSQDELYVTVYNPALEKKAYFLINLIQKTKEELEQPYE